MSKRFITVDLDTARKFGDPEGWTEWDDADWSTYLIDTHQQLVVGHDRCEPEDSTLDRHFSFVVDLLNEVAEESGIG